MLTAPAPPLTRPRLVPEGRRLAGWARWGIVAVLLLGLIAFAQRKQAGRAIVDILIEDPMKQGLHFVDKEEIFSHVHEHVASEFTTSRGSRVLGLAKLERQLEQSPYIERAHISQDLRGALTVRLEQARPIVRVIGMATQSDYYLTQRGKVVPTSDRFTPRTLLVEGPGARWLVGGRQHDDTLTGHILELAAYIEKNDFWRAQIASLHLDEHKEITIIPQLGHQKIEFGAPTGYVDKLAKLWVFYRQIVPVKGWSAYSFVSVKYDRQIVCH